MFITMQGFSRVGALARSTRVMSSVQVQQVSIHNWLVFDDAASASISGLNIGWRLLLTPLCLN